jgi:type II secretory pathway pseudopilin PulG
MTKNYKIRKFRRTNKGFTLVETLVAISIFSMSILGLLSILASGISDTSYAKQKMAAGYLAEEGIEYMRNMRDTFVLYDATDSQTGWSSFSSKLISAGCLAGTGCYFNDQNLNYTNHSQPMAGIAVSACGSSCPALLYDSTTGKYGYASGVSSGFIRKIQMSQISADEIKIISTVYWTQGSGAYNVSFSDNLFNWVQ